MKFSEKRQTPFTVAVVVSLLVQSGIAAPPLVPAPRPILDVALRPDGMLRGQLVNRQGNGLAKRKVVIRQQDRLLASVQTDAKGRFVVSGLRGGVFEVMTENGGGTFRLWSEGTAPPAARAGLLLVNANRPVMRGQIEEEQGGWMSQGWVRAAAIGAGVAGTTLGVIAITEDDKRLGS